MEFRVGQFQVAHPEFHQREKRFDDIPVFRKVRLDGRMDSLREAAAEYFTCKTGLQQRLPARQRDASARSPEEDFVRR